MNDRMRRYLDEDWDQTGEQEEPDRERDDKKTTNAVKQDRRQQGKEWGRAHAKYHRERKKAGLTSGKP